MKKILRNLALAAIVATPCAAMAEITGAGTAEDPYIIATAEDLQQCWTLTRADETVYFSQVADIDLTGITEWHALVGWDYATYSPRVNYNGNNHVIANFKNPDTGGFNTNNGYCGSIFGVLNGTVKNLGIVDMNINSAMGAGALAGYGGHSTGSAVVIENVYATGKVTGTNYHGGFFGTTANDVTIKNSFVNVEVSGAGWQAGLIGRLRNTAKIENTYVAGTVTGSTTQALVVASDKTPALTCTNVIAFNTGADAATVGAVVEGAIKVADAATEADLIAEVQGWAAFNATEDVNGYPALNYNLNGAGTEEDPYIIASAEDLCAAHNFVDGVNGGKYYFKQTADIDMANVQEYLPLAGWDGQYKGWISYDGGNHIISNFMPAMETPTTVDADKRYYCTSLFGVACGVIKNLGVVDAMCETTQGAGILGAYAGHKYAGDGLTIENVFVEGTLTNILSEGKSSYAGGMFGTTGMNVTMLNCYANVNVTGSANPTGGLIGRLDNTLTTENVYVAGTVAGEADLALVAGARTGKSPKLDAVNTIAFNTGSDKVIGGDIENVGEEVPVATEATKAELIATVQSWDAFNENKVFKGYPALNWQDAEVAGIIDIAIDEAEANGPAVYYNLQGVQVTNPENGIYIVRRGNKVTKEVIR